jgi:hypothetical protein
MPQMQNIWSKEHGLLAVTGTTNCFDEAWHREADHNYLKENLA